MNIRGICLIFPLLNNKWVARDSSRLKKKKTNPKNKQQHKIPQGSTQGEFHPFLKVLLQYLAINQEALVPGQPLIPHCVWLELNCFSFPICAMSAQGLTFWPTSYPGSTSLFQGLKFGKSGEMHLSSSFTVLMWFWGSGPLQGPGCSFWPINFGVQLCPCLPSRETGWGSCMSLHVTLRNAGVQLESAQAGALKANSKWAREGNLAQRDRAAGWADQLSPETSSNSPQSHTANGSSFKPVSKMWMLKERL